jgi:pilus assembly protein CpaC
MTSRKIVRRARLGTALIALATGLGTISAAVPATAQVGRNYKPSEQVLLSIGEGQAVSLSRAVADVWVSNPEVADVHVSNTRRLNLFGKKAGEATIIATASDGSVVYATNVRVSQNISSVNEMLRLAMPESNINVTTVGQMAVINGTVASPEDASQAELLVRSALNPGIAPGAPVTIMPINRLKTATPLQVNLRVKIAEVNRSLLKQVGVNFLSNGDSTGGFSFVGGQGSKISPGDPDQGISPKFLVGDGGTLLGGAFKLFGADLLGAIQLAELDGIVTTLAEPNLTALSGETASFLAGGEFPVPISQELGTITIEYKQYGVSLAFTPVVLGDGRISMRVRPEVSEISAEGSIRLNNYDIPALTTRRAETTVELGSGQSFMLAGLLQNKTNNSIDKAPFLGDVPILGALFRSAKYRRQETELVIIVTPYLVRPVSHQLALPTNGYRQPNDAEINLEGQSYKGVSGRPPVAPAPAPGIAAGATAAAPGFKL